MDGVTIERLQMHRDKRGKVFEPASPEILASGTLRNLHIATIAPGAVRGNHRHLNQTELICFFGRLTLALEGGNGVRETVKFDGDDCVLVTVEPGVAHAFLNPGDEEMFIVCYADYECGADAKEDVDLL